MTQACNHCAYFGRQDVQVNSEAVSGDCRINPPSASTQDKIAFWPVVKSKDWCGSFEAKHK
ncbi:MAG: hypothetical protein CML56_10140 [Rhodobacteraceae bacterium]|nr:hypothetical protein [Paracoccaceae bacterium]